MAPAVQCRGLMEARKEASWHLHWRCGEEGRLNLLLKALTAGVMLQGC